MLPLLRALSRRNPDAASAAADVLMTARHALGGIAHRIGDLCFAAEQALRYHDAEYRRSCERADVAASVVSDLIADMRRARDEAEQRRWKAAN